MAFNTDRKLFPVGRQVYLATGRGVWGTLPTKGVCESVGNV